MISIKQADLTDPTQANSVIELLNQYAIDPMGGGEALSDFTCKNLISTLKTRQDCLVILAYAEDRAIGLCNCFEAFSTFACKPLLNIHDVYVTENFRGQGIAKKLMQFAEEIARHKGYCKITLEVLSKNKSAQKSYRASGYKAYQLNEQFGTAEFWQKSL